LFDMFDTPAQLRGSYGMAQYLSRISVPSTPVALDLWARVQTATTEDVLYATVQREREGQPRWYTMCGRPVFDAGDTPVAFRGVTIDVTDLPVPTPTAPTDELLVAVLAQIDLALAVVDAAHQHSPGPAEDVAEVVGHPSSKASGMLRARTNMVAVAPNIVSRIRPSSARATLPTQA